MLQNITMRLLSKKNLPARGFFKEFMGLYIVPYIEDSPVVLEHLGVIGIDEIFYFGTTTAVGTATFYSMKEALREVGVELNDPEEIPIFVLSNKERHYGAISMVVPEILKKIGNDLGTNYWILPSSVHEVIITPDNGEVQAEKLVDMVKEINMTQVAPEEQLANAVFYYDIKSGLLSRKGGDTDE